MAVYLQLMASNINHSDQLRKHQSPNKSITVSLELHCASNLVHLARSPLKICCKATYPKNGRTRARTRDDKTPLSSLPVFRITALPAPAGPSKCHQGFLHTTRGPLIRPPTPFGTRYPTSTKAIEIHAFKTYSSVFHG